MPLRWSDVPSGIGPETWETFNRRSGLSQWLDELGPAAAKPLVNIPGPAQMWANKGFQLHPQAQEELAQQLTRVAQTWPNTWKQLSYIGLGPQFMPDADVAVFNPANRSVMFNPYSFGTHTGFGMQQLSNAVHPDAPIRSPGGVAAHEMTHAWENFLRRSSRRGTKLLEKFSQAEKPELFSHYARRRLALGPLWAAQSEGLADVGATALLGHVPKETVRQKTLESFRTLLARDLPRVGFRGAASPGGILAGLGLTAVPLLVDQLMGD